MCPLPVVNMLPVRRIQPFSFFFLISLRPPRSTLFPYTTLFRSEPSPTQSPSSSPTITGSTSPDVSGPSTSSRSEVLGDRKSTRLNSSHTVISYAVFCLKKKNIIDLIAKLYQYVKQHMRLGFS